MTTQTELAVLQFLLNITEGFESLDEKSEKMLRLMWSYFTADQKRELLHSQTVQDYANETGLSQELPKHRNSLAKEPGSPPHNPLYLALTAEFPGFEEDSDVNAGDLVDWFNENMHAVSAAAPPALLANLFLLFPGLQDLHSDVNGADLVDWVNENNAALQEF